jgi:predicted alpha/beta hydrolase family esterase
MVGHSLGGAAAVMSTTLLETPAPAKMILMGVFAESTRVIHDFARLLDVNQRVIRAIFKEIEKRSGIPIEAYSVTQKATLLKNVHGLVIHDADDAVAPVAEGRTVADAWNAVFLQTEGLGHRLQDKLVISAVVEFSKKEPLQGF